MVWQAYNNKFGTGFVSEEDEKRFQALRGVEHPYGAAQPLRLTGGEYFSDDEYEYRTVAGLNPHQPGWGAKVEPGYELAGFLSGGGNFFNAKTRNVWALASGAPMSGSDTAVGVIKRKKAKPEAAAPAAPEPTPAPTPAPPAPQLDASNPSLADALKQQGPQRQERPALQGALDSALKLDYWREAGTGETAAEASGTAQGAGTEASSADSGRRFAASDRWRQRLEEVSSRFA